MKSMRFVWPVQRKGSMEIQHSPRAVSAAKIAECVVCSALLTRPAVAYSYLELGMPPCQQVFVVFVRCYRFCMQCSTYVSGPGSGAAGSLFDFSKRSEVKRKWVLGPTAVLA